MDIQKAVSNLKQEPGFAENVGMLLVHNGVVRATSRTDDRAVTGVEVTPDHARIQTLCAEFEARPGIFRVHAEAASGRLGLGDDLLLLIVAGDVRENVVPALAELLDRVKAEAVSKTELF